MLKRVHLDKERGPDAGYEPTAVGRIRPYYAKHELRISRLTSRFLADLFAPAFQRLLHKSHELVSDGSVDQAVVVA
jgi:hypothetical protein